MKEDDLLAAIQAVRARARARAPDGNLGLEGVAAPDLTPLLHARDAAEAKVAAIGTVNPRPPGLKNSIAQALKKLIARALDWHVREQVEFNRAAMACVHATLEALGDVSRALAALAAREKPLREALEAYHRESAAAAGEMRDVCRHWAEWRPAFEERRSASEIHLLRTMSELQGAFQHRVTLLDQSYRELARQQHASFTAALDRNTIDVQKRLWQDLEQIRREYESLIYAELRALRQTRAVAQASAGGTPAMTQTPRYGIDWLRFAEVFRGPEERIREHQRKHAARFVGAAHEIVDIGCGRGEFLEAARELGLAARGVDSSEECVAWCASKGLAAARADLFEFLDALPDRSLGGAFCSQVIEHLPPERVPMLVALLAAKLHPGALALFETPNPECLAIFATHFYIDPTHTRPVPAALLRFYLEEAGFGGIEVERLEPAAHSMPALQELPPTLRDAFFGGLDYAILARKL
ncbi:MAG TPA: class I SAM-dependent methyltransferase [Bryobacteraceae bacterium]|nr:class I SAM-dependent methyltransferase [Bryobacteraceae bacterium]